MIAGDSPPGDSVTLTFDGADPEQISLADGQVRSNCRACAATFDDLIEKLERHDRLHVLTSNGEGVAFSLADARKAIGECTADFYR